MRLFRFLPWLFVLSSFALPVRIACIGDSITEGSGLGNPAVESYPARLQRLLGTNNFTVKNFGVSGRTLLKQGDFPYWKEAAFTNSQTFGPDIVIIQLGTNDGKPYNWKYGTNFVSNYKDMIAIYAALPSAPRIFLCAPCPVFGSGSFDIVPGIVHTNIAPAVRNLAAELTLPLVDLHARMTNSTLFPDTVHPNSQGMAAMAAVMHEALFPPTSAEPPAFEFRRVGTSTVILSWPQQWGHYVAQSSTTLRDTNTVWTIVDTSPAVGDGVSIRQTNTTFNATRFYQLRRP